MSSLAMSSLAMSSLAMKLSPDQLLEQSQWDSFWAPPDARVVDRPELLYLHCPRDLPFLNCVTRLRAEAEKLPALVDEVAQAHRGRRSSWRVLSIWQRTPLERRLALAGYAPGHRHHVYVLAPEQYLARVASGLRVERVASLQHLRAADDVRRAAFGDDQVPDPDGSELLHDLRVCTGAAARAIRFVAYDAAAGHPLSTGGLNLYPHLGFGFLWGGSTVPSGRGRGAYSAVLAARIDFARRVGLRAVGLYARSDTSAPIVARQGFERHGDLVDWQRAADP